MYHHHPKTTIDETFRWRCRPQHTRHKQNHQNSINDWRNQLRPYPTYIEDTRDSLSLEKFWARSVIVASQVKKFRQDHRRESANLYRSFLRSNRNPVAANRTHFPFLVLVIVATHPTRIFPFPFPHNQSAIPFTRRFKNSTIKQGFDLFQSEEEKPGIEKRFKISKKTKTQIEKTRKKMD